MAIKGVSTEDVYVYVSPKDEGEPKTEFVIKTLSVKEKIDMMDYVKETDDMATVIRNTREILKMGLKEIRNLKIGDKFMSFGGDEIESALDRIPLDVMVEVAGEVIKYNFVSEEEGKN